MIHRPLDGMTVVDLSRILAGPFATQHLFDLGARVIKVEAPGGDATRSWGPPFTGDDRSAYFDCCNRGKESIVVDLNLQRDRELVARLVASADVVVENFRGDDVLARFDLGLADFRARHPRLVTCSIRGFRSDGPDRGRPNYDGLSQAMEGLMSVTGPPDDAGSKVGVPIIDVVSGLNAAVGILGLLAGPRDDCRHVEVSLDDSAHQLLVNVGASYLATGDYPKRHGNQHPTIVPYGTFACRDGHVFIGVGSDRQWRALASALDAPELLAEQGWQSNAGRVADREHVEMRLVEQLAPWDSTVVETRLRAAGVPVGQLRTVPEALRGAPLLTLDDGGSAPRTPVQLLGLGERTASPPALGQHTNAIRAEFDAI